MFCLSIACFCCCFSFGSSFLQRFKQQANLHEMLSWVHSTGFTPDSFSWRYLFLNLNLSTDHQSTAAPNYYLLKNNTNNICCRELLQASYGCLKCLKMHEFLQSFQGLESA